MYQNQRNAPRIPCDGDGYLVLGDERPATEVGNISKGGACLLVPFDTWVLMEELDVIDGGVTIDNSAFTFTGRICWSLVENNRVRFGLEFIRSDRDIIEKVLENLSLMVEEPEDNSFNL
ncbi:PilZ domain-containing protein [Acanthopleuribacter pedis]|uniref:PilZ domain-containing protein n=1 Tax=Acanthopleuribacter pedis TaxID=442870 RepID=A0A8J7QF74_9BACT|nr:PilZ domain-containing protein [Acanthopleuribacter pedis]MBO1319571.1 PilZ domain-containing protein [Acanthopleuribacter pedis]